MRVAEDFHEINRRVMPSEARAQIATDSVWNGLIRGYPGTPGCRLMTFARGEMPASTYFWKRNQPELALALKIQMLNCLASEIINL